MRVLLLPGMDGGARLLSRLCECLPDWIAPEVVAYPGELRSYAELEERVRARIASTPEAAALVAESFSGPIGIRIAADPPPQLRALVLVATFALRPGPAWLGHLVGTWLFRVPPPSFVLRRTLLDVDASDAMVREVRAAIAATPARVLSARARDALRVDVRAELARIDLPLLYVAGSRDRLLGDPRAITRWRSDLRVEPIDAPHLVLQCAPERSAEVIARFLASREGRAI